jgi:mannose-6-phosphate isomerase-like protein (cupin superfamily)
LIDHSFVNLDAVSRDQRRLLTHSLGVISIWHRTLTNVLHETPVQAMPTLISQPTQVEAAGNKPKVIDEFFGQVNTGDSRLSIARMRSPGGWIEPGQVPEFDEFTVVLAGSLRVEHCDGVIDVAAGQAVMVRGGEWVRYSTPDPAGAEYFAVCLPAFSLDTVHRDPF